MFLSVVKHTHGSKFDKVREEKSISKNTYETQLVLNLKAVAWKALFLKFQVSLSLSLSLASHAHTHKIKKYYFKYVAT
jgi:hypothetical protein